MINGDKIRQMSDEELDRINCIFCGNSDVLIDVFGEGSVTCLKCGMTSFQKKKPDNVAGYRFVHRDF